MKNVFNAPLISVPLMHRELLPASFPSCVLPVWPGLPAPRGEAWHGESWFLPAWPYSSAEAAACRADIERLDETGLSAFSEIPDRKTLGTQEKRDLEHFAKSGLASPCAVKKPETDVLLRWAQRMLLLGWVQEERVLEVQALTERYRKGAHRLSEQFHGETGTPAGEDREAFSAVLAAIQELAPDNAENLLPSWKFMLELFAVVLPETAVLFTADARMIRALRDQNLCRQPCERDLLPDVLKGQAAALTWGHEPFWKIIGRNAPLADRPWLDRFQTVLLLDAETIAEDA